MQTIPEKTLLFAILEMAVLDLFKVCGSTRTDQIQAREWLFDWESEDICEPFSFPWICIELDLSPKIVRDFVKRLLKTGVRPVKDFSDRYRFFDDSPESAFKLSGTSFKL